MPGADFSFQYDRLPHTATRHPTFGERMQKVIRQVLTVVTTDGSLNATVMFGRRLEGKDLEE